MKTIITLPTVSCLIALVLFAFGLSSAKCQPTVFTYQGNLASGGVPLSGTYGFRFTLFDAPTGGSAASGTATAEPVSVNNGAFTVPLDFGANTFSGANRWLEISVRTNDSLLPFQTLDPRQLISSVPYAITARTASNVAAGAVVKSINSLRDNVSLVAGANVTIASNANGLIISSTGGGGGGPWLLSGSNAYYNAGRVGIGTSSPQTPLEVATGASGEGVRLRGPLSGNANQSWLSFYDSAGTRIGYVGDGSALDRSVYLGSDSGDVILYTAAGRAVTVTSGGLVGIGTSTPSAKLHIVGGDILAGTPGEEWIIHTRSHAGSDFLQITDSDGGVYQWQRGLVVHQNGGVGIGTTFPQAALDVRGDIKVGASGTYSAASGEENLRILRGVVT